MSTTRTTMHITDIRTVAVPVTDQDRALAFYRDDLGIRDPDRHGVRRRPALAGGLAARCLDLDRARASGGDGGPPPEWTQASG